MRFYGVLYTKKVLSLQLIKFLQTQIDWMTDNSKPVGLEAWNFVQGSLFDIGSPLKKKGFLRALKRGWKFEIFPHLIGQTTSLKLFY